MTYSDPRFGVAPDHYLAGATIVGQGLRPLSAHAFLPHVTLYLTNYLAGRLPQIERRVRVLAAGVHPFDLGLGRIVATPSHWLLLKVMANRRMQRLADAVTRALDPLRVPHPPMSGWVKAYPEKREVF